ncbi:protein kinase [Gemmata sp. JC717]|uniref:protein kinase domain-containing protein n=1 Tax=Gemmata algarum TaxID=2975278 RepID=UPI0021BBAA62|nr:protein kinase [Gemmata algarum]MDY3553349.1 protein kinase [Gemmata algarum]
MPVSYRCPNPGCGVALKTPMRLRGGKVITCPRCGFRFVPEPSGEGLPLRPDSTGGPLPSPDTRAQGSAERARLDPLSAVQAVEPMRLSFATGDPLPGLSSWVLERQIGAGGFGEVWLVRHEWKAERRAVKFFTHPDVRHRLVTHEKKVLVRVMKHAGDHPNIVPLLECNLDGDVPWLMYEYVEGGTLIDAVREWQARTAPKRVRRAVRTLLAIAEAIAHCHRLKIPIVHRDLKPANVLRDAAGTFRVTDFGIGGAASAPPADGATHGYLTNSGRVPTLLRAAGSFGYASPQQRNGDPPDPRDDVYALGVLGFQMLMGDLTRWPGPDMADDLRALGLTRSIVSLLVQSVSHNPARRPGDAHEWKLALESLTTKSGADPGSTGAHATITPPPAVTPPGRGTDSTADGRAPGDSR